MKISARNQLPGTVASIQTGAVNNQVTINLDQGGQLVAIITDSACKELGLAEGKPVTALIKASSILLATD